MVGGSAPGDEQESANPGQHLARGNTDVDGQKAEGGDGEDEAGMDVEEQDALSEL